MAGEWYSQEFAPTPWILPEGQPVDDDAIYAINTFSHLTAPTARLYSDTHGFTIPASATIAGVIVSVEVYSNSFRPSKTYRVHLANGSGTLIGTAKTPTNEAVPFSPTVFSYGDATDLWDYALTPTIVNGANFGAAIQYTYSGSNGARTVNVDYISVEVFYTLPAELYPDLVFSTGPSIRDFRARERGPRNADRRIDKHIAGKRDRLIFKSE